VSKIGRLDEKDLEAFRLVIERTGHPTADEFLRHLQFAVDLYRPAFDEEKGGDYVVQTRFLWREIFNKEIDVREQIIRPAIQRRQDAFQSDAGDSRVMARLRNLKR
jgi:hypothetical protein